MNEVDDFRERLGGRLVFWATLALVLLAIVTIVAAAFAPGKDRASSVTGAAQLLISALLPLLGTWVGTILAFYYTKENYQAASASTLNVVRTIAQRLSSTRIAEKMMPRSQIIAETVPPGQALGDVKISAVENRFKATGANGQRISRLLILDSTDACIAILHRAVYNEVLVLGLRDSPPIDVASDTLGKLLGKPYASGVGTTYEDFVRKTIAFVAQDRTVADAKAVMEGIPGCQDVIVTATGNSAEPVVGWISNVDVGRLSQA